MTRHQLEVDVLLEDFTPAALPAQADQELATSSGSRPTGPTPRRP